MSNDSFHVLVKHREPQRHHWLEEVVSDSPEVESMAAVSDYAPVPWIRSAEMLAFIVGLEQRDGSRGKGGKIWFLLVAWKAADFSNDRVIGRISWLLTGLCWA